VAPSENDGVACSEPTVCPYSPPPAKVVCPKAGVEAGARAVLAAVWLKREGADASNRGVAAAVVGRPNERGALVVAPKAGALDAGVVAAAGTEGFPNPPKREPPVPAPNALDPNAGVVLGVAIPAPVEGATPNEGVAAAWLLTPANADAPPKAEPAVPNAGADPDPAPKGVVAPKEGVEPKAGVELGVAPNVAADAPKPGVLAGVLVPKAGVPEPKARALAPDAPNPAAPKAGALAAGVLAPKAGVLAAPKAGALAPNAPKAGILAVPNAGVLVPKAGVLAAPKAGVLEAPKAGVEAAPNAGVLEPKEGVAVDPKAGADVLVPNSPPDAPKAGVLPLRKEKPELPELLPPKPPKAILPRALLDASDKKAHSVIR
jgi:hypothetical protein